MKTRLRAEEWEELIPDQSVNGAEGTRWRDTHAEPLVCTKEKVSLELLRQKGQSWRFILVTSRNCPWCARYTAATSYLLL